ncbi:MAG: hypothetical protein AABO58_02755 [Acidobacteriota bacterium]
MRPNRKADLQRKLSLAPVPKPPAGLADRIKGEIPKPLLVDAEKERVRLRQSVAFNIRVAASIILLVSSLYLALNLVSRKFAPEKFEAATNSAPAAPAPQPQLAAARELDRIAPSPAPPPPSVAARPSRPRLNDQRQAIVAEARPEPIVLEEVASKDESAGVKEGVVGGVAEAITVNAAAPMAKAAAAPASQSADALVQRFARADNAPATLTLDVEAAAAPFDDAKYIVRVSLDGPHDGRADVAFNDAAVAAWHGIASNGTSLYEITLRSGRTGNEVIATVRAGAMKRAIRRGDLREWNDASRRMKLASLAAALAAGAPPEKVAAKARAAGLDDLAAAAEARRR